MNSVGDGSGTPAARHMDRLGVYLRCPELTGGAPTYVRDPEQQPAQAEPLSLWFHEASSMWCVGPRAERGEPARFLRLPAHDFARDAARDASGALVPRADAAAAASRAERASSAGARAGELLWRAPAAALASLRARAKDATRAPRYGESMRPETRTALDAHFRPHNRRLRALLGNRSLPHAWPQ